MVLSMIVEVIHVTPEELFLKVLELSERVTVMDALLASEVFQAFPELDSDELKVGIFGKLVEQKKQLKEGDRVEGYRPLIFDPKEARRLRAQKKAEQMPEKKKRRRRLET